MTENSRARVIAPERKGERERERETAREYAGVCVIERETVRASERE